jgi:hypothetical protein
MLSDENNLQLFKTAEPGAWVAGASKEKSQIDGPIPDRWSY